jgi:hypothetical protein
MAEVTNPSEQDLARLAEADLAVCEKASRGPWAESFRGLSVTVNVAGGEYVATFHAAEPSLVHEQAEDNARFTALARDALPAWIRRAEAAEKELARLHALFTKVRETQDAYEAIADTATKEQRLERFKPMCEALQAVMREVRGDGDEDDTQTDAGRPGSGS